MINTDRERLFRQLDARNAALAKPIDFEQLERDGLLAGHATNQSLKIARPEHSCINQNPPKRTSDSGLPGGNLR